MKLSQDIIKYIDQSILCWLATSSNGIPNVSPKEVFTYYKDTSIIVANIASPNTLRNIKINNQVCISFINILVQKGYQIKGQAEIIGLDHTDFKSMEEKLLVITQGKFPFSSITKIKVETVKPIIAPGYILYPDTTEDDQIMSAKKAYGI